MTQQSGKQDLGQRTKQFALRVIRLCDALPSRWTAQTIGKQVLRCGTSVSAQYREGRRARSTAEYISKVESALQELDETTYWLELVSESGIFSATRLAPLQKEADELCAILVSCVKTARRRK
jgi:four helix bundle protein